MTAYITSPFQVRSSLLPGAIGFSFGSLDTHNPGSRMAVTSVAITTNVATVAVKLLEGPIPTVGSLISIQGTQTASGTFNVTNVALASVSLDLTTGVGTVTFALTHADVATTADAGQALVPAPMVLETLPGSATAGKQFAIASANLATDGQRGITWFTQYSGSPSTVAANLQGADIDTDAEYTTIDASTSTAGESRSLGNVNYQFYRIQMASTGGTSPKCAAGIMVR